MTTQNFIYNSTIDALRKVCQQHIDGITSAEELQCEVQRAETAIVALEEKDIRSKMTDIEGQLELIKFNVERDLQTSETKKLAIQLLEWLRFREQGVAQQWKIEHKYQNTYHYSNMPINLFEFDLSHNCYAIVFFDFDDILYISTPQQALLATLGQSQLASRFKTQE